MKFPSKRNDVFLIDGLVYKALCSESAAAVEADALIRLRRLGAVVPCVLRVEGRSIVMEYVRGLTLPDYIELAPDCDCQALSEVLCAWMASFYRAEGAVGEIRGDVNGRNFIISREGGQYRVTGVDFEERVFGEPERDFGRLCAFLRTYDMPSEAAARSRAVSCGIYVRAVQMGMDRLKMLRYFKQELVDIKKRRQGNATDYHCEACR